MKEACQNLWFRCILFLAALSCLVFCDPQLIAYIYLYLTGVSSIDPDWKLTYMVGIRSAGVILLHKSMSTTSSNIIFGKLVVLVRL